MAKAKIAAIVGEASVRLALANEDDREAVATAVRYTLQQLAEKAEGNTVEVRVPPFGAVQAIEGPRHTRGTPPNVGEMDAPTWLALATGSLSWDAALGEGRIGHPGPVPISASTSP